MPFTISHVAVVLPFSRVLTRWRLLCATVIGSMVPDFGFLIPLRLSRIETHSAIGLLTFCLPMGLATFWIFQRLMKTAVMEVLPDATYARWRPLGAPADIVSLKEWVLGACGVLAGATSHLVWDAFTHEGARGVRMVPALDDPVVDFAGHHLVGARLLQDASSLIGLGIVLAVVVYGLRPGRRGDVVPERTLRPGERHAWILVFAGTAIVLAGWFLSWRHSHSGVAGSLALSIGTYAVAALRGFAAAFVVVSLSLALRLRTNR